MKFGKTVLVAIATIVGLIYLIVANAAPTYLPPFSRLFFWGGIVAPLVLATIIIALWQANSEKKEKKLDAIASASQEPTRASNSLKTVQHPQSSHLQKQITHLESPNTTQQADHTPLPHLSPLNTSEEGQPTVEHPALFCFALDVSDTMIDSVIDHAGKTIKKWASIQTILDRFIYLGAAFVKDPETRTVLPLYYLIAYGFGFTERAYHFGINKKPGGTVRDLLAYPSFPILPSVAEITDHWSEYKKHLTSRKYTLDLLGDTPLCYALTLIRDRLKEELKHKEFSLPILLLIVSDGKPTDGDPLPIIADLHAMRVLTLCCYLGDQDILKAKRLYKAEDQHWSEGAKCMFHSASVLRNDSYLSRAMLAYLSDTGWNSSEGVRLFAQINHTEALDSFLKILLSGFMQERKS